jgi:LAO/AO transport system ATPase
LSILSASKLGRIVLESLLDRFRHGDRQALSRLLTLAAHGESLEAIQTALPAPFPATRVIAVTGSAGVGKSTLIGRLTEFLRAKSQKVAVLACDPQSPVSGGALLGDRYRMPARPDDDGVFIRSLSAQAGHGAVADHLAVLIRLLAVYGFDVVLLETVGAGQGDVAVRELADVVLLLLQPEAGDDLQWEKAGLLEVADVVAINKADLPQAELIEAQVRNMLGLSSAPAIPVVRVSARTGAGIDSLWQAVASSKGGRTSPERSGRELVRQGQAWLAEWFQSAQSSPQPKLQDLLKRWEQGMIQDHEAAQEVVRLCATENPA